jgi:hypothetical protein
MPSRLFVVAVSILVGSIAHAEPLAIRVPEHCEVFQPANTDEPTFWDSWLSLASCLADASIADVRDPKQLPSMVGASTACDRQC